MLTKRRGRREQWHWTVCVQWLKLILGSWITIWKSPGNPSRFIKKYMLFWVYFLSRESIFLKTRNLLGWALELKYIFHCFSGSTQTRNDHMEEGSPAHLPFLQMKQSANSNLQPRLTQRDRGREGSLIWNCEESQQRKAVQFTWVRTSIQPEIWCQYCVICHNLWLKFFVFLKPMKLNLMFSVLIRHKRFLSQLSAGQCSFPSQHEGLRTNSLTQFSSRNLAKTHRTRWEVNFQYTSWAGRCL